MGFRAPARTLAVGAACGVIAVLRLGGAGQVTMATLRTDVADTDGRHPAGVTFSTALERLETLRLHVQRSVSRSGQRRGD